MYAHRADPGRGEMSEQTVTSSTFNDLSIPFECMQCSADIQELLNFPVVITPQEYQVLMHLSGVQHQFLKS